jgi:ABC-2 type transport system ATP-binding protein
MSLLAVDAEGVSKRYGDRDVLTGVDLAVPPGALHGLLGPNGAGKTTLMRALLGLVRRNAGSVRLLGSDIGVPGGRLPAGIAAMVDTSEFYPYLTGRQNLLLLARLDDSRATTDKARVEHALEEAGLTSQADLRVQGYSAGMRQRLGLAAACMRAPLLMFLDEPTSSLDPISARQVRTLVQRMSDAGTAIVFSSHDMAEVEELCTTITVINGGRVAFSGPVDALRALAPATVIGLSTSDDNLAVQLAANRPGLRLISASHEGLELVGDGDAVDEYVIALGQARVAVRLLARRVRSLESLFIELTSDTVPQSHAVHFQARHTEALRHRGSIA